MHIICPRCKRPNPQHQELLVFYCGICGEPIVSNAQNALLRDLQKEIANRLVAIDKSMYLVSDRALDAKVFDFLMLLQEAKRSDVFWMPNETNGDGICSECSWQNAKTTKICGICGNLLVLEPEGRLITLLQEGISNRLANNKGITMYMESDRELDNNLLTLLNLLTSPNWMNCFLL